MYNKREDGRIEWVCKHGVGHTVDAPKEYKKIMVDETEETNNSSEGENLEKKSELGENQEQKSSKQLDPEIQQRDAKIAHYREKGEKLQKDFDEYKKTHPDKPEKTDKTEDVEEWVAPKDPLS